jgi:hypothetical protein
MAEALCAAGIRQCSNRADILQSREVLSAAQIAHRAPNNYHLKACFGAVFSVLP